MCSHSLRGEIFGPAQNRHGATYAVTAEFRGPALDEHNILLDLGWAKQALGEALRPLEIFKWIIIPLLLILVMIYRPTGLVAFKEFDPEAILRPKTDPERERDALPQG